jgi:hypothetical protein
MVEGWDVALGQSPDGLPSLWPGFPGMKGEAKVQAYEFRPCWSVLSDLHLGRDLPVNGLSA